MYSFLHRASCFVFRNTTYENTVRCLAGAKRSRWLCSNTESDKDNKEKLWTPDSEGMIFGSFLIKKAKECEKIWRFKKENERKLKLQLREKEGKLEEKEKMLKLMLLIRSIPESYEELEKAPKEIYNIEFFKYIIGSTEEIETLAFEIKKAYVDQLKNERLKVSMSEFNRNVFKFIIDHHEDLESLKFKKTDLFPRRTAQYTVRHYGAKGIFRWVFDLVRRYQKHDEEINYMALMSFYVLSGMARFVHRVFDEMPERKCDRTVYSLNVLLASYLHSRKFYLVNKAFRTLPTQVSIEPNLVSYHIFIMAFCEKGSFDLALSVLKEMEEKGVEPDSITYNILLENLYSKGNFEDSNKLWGKMIAKDVTPCVWSYTSKLKGLAKNKSMSDAVQLFNQMKEEYVMPDIFCINAVMQGFVNKDNLDKAKEWFDKIIYFRLYPHKSTFDILVPFLCKKGDLKTLFMVCFMIFYTRTPVNPWMLELAVDKMLHEGMDLEAMKMVDYAKACLNYELNLVDEKTLAAIYKCYGC